MGSSDWTSASDSENSKEAEKEEMDDDSEPQVKKLKSMKELIRGDGPGGLGRPSATTWWPSRNSRRRQGVHESDGLEDFNNSQSYSSEETSVSDDGAKEDATAIYAPRLTCHSCRQRNVKWKVHCSRCPNRFCDSCLRKRNGEQLEVEAHEGVKWVCPKCRGGCGPGCNNCCNCAPCRKSQGQPATGQLAGIARKRGFNNIHDYLIHCQTGESPSNIAKRKEGRGWTSAGFKTEPPGKQQQQRQSWNNAGRACTVQPGNQRTTLTWTKAGVSTTGSIRKSLKGKAKRQNGEPSGPIMWSEGVVRKNSANALEGLMSNKDEHNKSDDDQKNVRDQVLTRITPKRRRGNLEQIIEMLSFPENVKVCNSDQASEKFIQQVKRSRRHSKIARFMKPSALGNPKDDDAEKVDVVNPELSLTVILENIEHCDQAPTEPIRLERKSTSLQTLQNYCGHGWDRASLKEPTQMTKPVTSLQALRKMGILSKRDDADSTVKQQRLQSKEPATATPMVGHFQFNQVFQQNFQGLPPTSPPPSPNPASPDPSDSGLQAILMRHLERRKKMVVRSSAKIHPTDRIMPASPLGVFSETRSLTTFEMRSQTDIRTGFESYSHSETLVGFGSFRVE